MTCEHTDTHTLCRCRFHGRFAGQDTAAEQPSLRGHELLNCDAKGVPGAGLLGTLQGVLVRPVTVRPGPSQRVWHI